MSIEWANSRWKDSILWRTKTRKNYRVWFGYDFVVDWEIGEFWRIFQYYLPWFWRERFVEEPHNVGNPISHGGDSFRACGSGSWVVCETERFHGLPQSRMRNNVRPLKQSAFSLLRYVGMVRVAERGFESRWKICFRTDPSLAREDRLPFLTLNRKD